MLEYGCCLGASQQDVPNRKEGDLAGESDGGLFLLPYTCSVLSTDGRRTLLRETWPWEILFLLIFTCKKNRTQVTKKQFFCGRNKKGGETELQTQTLFLKPVTSVLSCSFGKGINILPKGSRINLYISLRKLPILNLNGLQSGWYLFSSAQQ